MPLSDRYYRFREFDREILYDIEAVSAFTLDKTEAKLVDSFLDGNKFSESIAVLETTHSYTRDKVRDSLQTLKAKGFWVDRAQASIQKPAQTYTLTLNVTHACNLKCRYCYIDKSSICPPYMSERTANRAVDYIFRQYAPSNIGIAFYGGEPLLNFEVIRSTIEYTSKRCRECGLPPVKYHITTNGTLLTDVIIDFFRDHNINVMISIDGPSLIHDAFRKTPAGKGTHTVVSRNLTRLLCKNGLHKVSTSSVITRNARLKVVYDYLTRHLLQDIKLSYVRYLDEKDYGLTDFDKQQYMQDMRYIANKTMEMLRQGKRPPYYNFETNILQLWKGSKRDHFCPAGQRRFGISPNGDIYPCGPAAAMHEWKLGSINIGIDSDRLNTWNLAATYENKSDCQICWARYLCAGGCPLRMMRSFDKQRCEINQHSVRLAIAIYTAIKEKNEMMLAALVDEQFLSRLLDLLPTAAV